MSILESSFEQTDAPAEPQSLDPYAYQPGIGSAVAGLAAGGTGSDLNYVFHTDYVEAGRGHAQFEVRFHGLTAKQGSLRLRIHLRREHGHPQLVLVTSEVIAFNRLIRDGGTMTIPFEAFNECTYAFYGSVQGETDAAATGLEVILHPGRATDDLGYGTQARNSEHGQDSSRPNPILVSTQVPTLDAPVSQVATAAQLRSAAAKQALTGMAEAKRLDPVRRWAAAYTIRCLAAYGVTHPGARGLGLCPADDAVAQRLGRDDMTVTCLDQSEGWARPGKDQINYDFLWGFVPAPGAASREEWLEDMQRSLFALLPGGLACLTFAFDPTPATDRAPGEVGYFADRRDVERLALLLISRGHEVAQLRLVGDFGPLVTDDDGVSGAGLVIRRARLPE
jgi:hypothetical protein